jgi:hypothetical protein
MLSFEKLAQKEKMSLQMQVGYLSIVWSSVIAFHQYQ